jgi:hypothetical protein
LPVVGLGRLGAPGAVQAGTKPSAEGGQSDSGAGTHQGQWSRC